jgi:hypothetical protein
MHPEIARELIAQRGRELRDQAHQASVARTVIRKFRAARRGASLPHEADDFICPAIPDYVDGSFQTVSPTEDQAASPAGRVPAARPAA